MPTGIYKRIVGINCGAGIYKGINFGSKGKHWKLSEKAKINHSIANKGKKRTEEQKRKYSEALRGNKNHFGKKHSEETKRKMSLIKLEKPSNSKGKHWKLSERVKIKMSESHIKIWDEKGRKKYKRYKHLCSRKEYRDWREAVFTRDNWTCQKCGVRSKKGKTVYLEAHHIKSWVEYPKLRYEVNNGVTLCYECHLLTRKKK